MPRGSVRVICVEPWTCSAGHIRLMSRASPRSCTMIASAPASAIAPDEPQRLGQLVGEDQRVEGHVAADVMAVEVVDDLRQLVGGEVGGAVAGVEGGQAEVDRVGPVGHRRPHRLPVAGGGEQFRGRPPRGGTSRGGGPWGPWGLCGKVEG